MSFSFQLDATDPNTSARAGRITTAHGEVLTPGLMPVGTAADRTVGWAAAGLAERAARPEEGRGAMALFAINQGGTDAGERARCFAGLAQLPFDGFALGGLWVGEGKSLGLDMVARDC